VTVRLSVDRAARGTVSRADVLRRARAMLEALGLQQRELSLVLTDDERIQELNRAYRDKDKPTDVLAFSQLEGAFGHGAGSLLGDVIVSIPTAARQARARKTDLTSELTMLLAHGLLHLVGWDHDTAPKDRKMRRETARLCAYAERASVRARRKEITK
jgi:probable rRNA maturation factor